MPFNDEKDGLKDVTGTFLLSDGSEIQESWVEDGESFLVGHKRKPEDGLERETRWK